MADLPPKHPRFNRPPVVETVLSIEFAPLSEWQIPHFGLYWAPIRNRYPKFDVKGILVSHVEDLNSAPSLSQPILLNVSDSPPPVRLWFYNDPETQLIQIQNDRFIFNWKKGLVEEPYPHYAESIKPRVAEEWGCFREFVARSGLGKIEVKQCEIAYINHIEMGLGWENYGEFGRIFRLWSGEMGGSVLPPPEDADLGLRYRLPDSMGRLYIRAQPAIRHVDQREVIQLTIMARGRPRSQEPSEVFDWFDVAQRWTARSFVDVTTQEMHSLWGVRG